MDFRLSEEQEMLKKATRSFLEKECPKKLVRDMEEDEKGYSPQLWSRMAELGWMGLMLPAEYGGEGRNFLDFAILLEEAGRALLPAPLIPTIVYGSLPILYFGSQEQKKEWLPQIAQGKLIMTLALTETAASLGKDGIEMKAVRDGGNYVLNGTKLFVTGAGTAGRLLCAAKTGRGITLFLVAANSPGLSFTLLKTLASDRQYEVNFNNVKVPAKDVMGKVGGGWEIVKKIEEWGALAQCAMIAGALQYVLEMTVDYTKTRIQFERPIGSFQAIQHQLADMLIDVDGAKFLTYEAAWKLSEGMPAAMDISCAKAWASDASRRVCLMGHKIHSGVAQIKDHDMQLYFRRAKLWELTMGDGDFHREIVAGELGL